MLVGFISFFRRGSASQLVTGALWTLFFMVIVTTARPFNLGFSDQLKTAVDCAVLITLILSMMMKMDLSDEAFSAETVAYMMIGTNVCLPLSIVLLNLPVIFGGGERPRGRPALRPR